MHGYVSLRFWIDSDVGDQAANIIGTATDVAEYTQAQVGDSLSSVGDFVSSIGDTITSFKDQVKYVGTPHTLN